MIDSNTIKLVGDYPAAGQVHTVDGHDHIIIPNNCKLLDVEPYQLAPRRTRACVSVTEVASFLTYLEAFFRRDESQVFAQVSTSGLTATCYVDYPLPEAPSWVGHVVTLTTVHSPEWQRWKSKHKVALTQEEFLMFIEENMPTFVEPCAVDLLAIARDLSLKQEVEWRGSKRLDSGDTSLSFVSTTKTGGAGDVELPSTLRIALPVFAGGDSFQMDVRLRPRLEEGHLSLRFEMVLPEMAIKAATDAIRLLIETTLETKILIGSASVG